jgi:regulatory protein YycH of two-component signal transduction system YycFG
MLQVYTTDGVKFSKTTKISDIPVNAGYELYVDTTPIKLTDEFGEVLRRGVKVCYLRRLNMIEERCEKVGLKKNSKSDLKALMTIEPRWFREVDEDLLIMRRKISAYS